MFLRYFPRPRSLRPHVCGLALVLSAAALGAESTSTTQSIRLGAPVHVLPQAAHNEADAPPPLSIYESCEVLGGVISRLGGQDPLSTATLRRLDRQLYTVILYVDRVDRTHPTLPFYAWEEVSEDKAPKDGWKTQTFRLFNPIPQVTALSIRARHGDIVIKYLAAIDRNQTRWEFNQTIHVPANQPRPEVCFLPLPTELTEVRITCRRADPKAQRWARLFIDAGVSSIPESAKQAIYHLQRARADLNARRPEARRHLGQAYELLREYQKNRRF